MRLTILVGMSGSGKDFYLNKLVGSGNAERYVTATTRPMRAGEVDGTDYHFLTREKFEMMLSDGDIIEHRSYNTKNNGKDDVWYYGTPVVDTSEDKDYVIVVDIDGAKALIDRYGRENCFVVALLVPHALRRARAKRRGSFDNEEWERRLEDDKVKFSKERMEGIVNLYICNYCRGRGKKNGYVKERFETILKAKDEYFGKGTCEVA